LLLRTTHQATPSRTLKYSPIISQSSPSKADPDCELANNDNDAFMREFRVG
jgi:hypothetical protein